MTRRNLLAGLGLGGLSRDRTRAASTHGPRIEVWHSVPCPRCTRPVAFLPGQRRNRCGWCGSRVRR